MPPKAHNTDILIQTRSSVNSQLMRIYTFVKAFKKGDSIHQIESRSDKLDEIWNRFDELQSKLEAVDFNQYQEDRVQFENTYYYVTGEIKRIIAEDESRASHIPQIQPVERNTTQQEQTDNLSSKVSLPKMKLPQFSGEYKEWRCFYDLFKVIIHENTTISNIEKLFYLKSSLAGEALKIIDSIPSTSDNYETAFKLLIDRFDNNQLIINAHLSNLFALNTIQKQSASALRTLLTEANQQIESLKALKLPVEHWDVILIHLLTQKLDFTSRREWELRRVKDKLPKLSDFFSFLETRCLSLEVLETSAQSVNRVSTNYFNKPRGKATQVLALTSNQTTAKCNICEANHRLYKCDKFNAMNVPNRIEAVKAARVCFNCLNPGHSVKSCTASRCKKCNKPHNTFIHYERVQNQESEDKPSENQPKEQNTITLLSSYKPRQILLSTAIIKIKNQFGKWINCRALLDSGSQSNCVTEKLVNQLNIQQNDHESKIIGINGAKTQINKAVKLVISSRLTNYHSTLEFLVLEKITSELPIERFDVSSWEMLRNIKLADPSFNEPGQIDLLIGAEIYFKILKCGQRCIGDNLPIIKNSEFGWIVSGKVEQKNDSVNTSYALFSSTSPIEEILVKFWELENFPKRSVRSREEIECEEHFQTTINKTKSGRYIAQLPIRENKINLIGNSREFATKRLDYLWQRLSRDLKLRDQYIEFMQEYLSLNHMELLPESDENPSIKSYYIPHHAVIKETNDGAKLRVVFDASMKSDTGVSLNDALKVGPVVQQDLISIVMRFRLYKFAFTSDIQKILKTVTYGTASAPYIATKCIQHLATTEGDQYPLAKAALLNSCYVDDIITGANSIEEALELQRQLIKLLKKGEFVLHKWGANHADMLQEVEPNKRESLQSLEIGKEAIKTLGLLWLPSADKFKFVIKLKTSNLPTNITKRSILSDTAGIFDPLGLIGPIVIKAKVFLQQLWKLKISWDDQLPNNLAIEWSKFRTKLQQIDNLEVDRRMINIEPTDLKYEIYGFADASQIAYGACLYLKAINDINEISVALITAKSRVAPVKPTTIPRLELCAALTLSRLLDKVLSSLQFKEVSVHLFTDSTITLQWILSDASKYKTFVGNRVIEIQELTKNCIWHHVPTSHNPADLLSRGVTPTELKKSELWWNGPQWLQLNESDWPKTGDANHQLPDIELKPPKSVTMICVERFHIFEKFSSLLKLQRVTAYIKRFSHNTRNPNNKMKSELSTNELQSALICLIKIAQDEELKEELDLLKNKQEVNRGNLKSLMPFLDDQNLLRVGGRLQNSLREYEHKHQIILPKNHKLTKLMIQHEHNRLLHAGTQAVLGSIRQKYWPVHGRSIVRKVIHQCVKCYRYITKPCSQLMGNLPSYRVQPFRAFQNSGVDYGGPILVKSSSRRNSPLIKSYIALFVCLSTRAIHVELVIGLDTQSFLNAFKRFVSRRGLCCTIHSDNATNFKGAEKEMNELYQLFRNQNSKREIVDGATKLGVQWKFIPPNAPHFGGIWEAGIKAVKYHLKRVMGTLHLTYEETYTILTQIEACVNSRPLSQLTDDPSDPVVLTPAHFLIGCPITAMPEPDLTDVEETRLARWQQMQKRVQSFWRRWSQDYLNTLQQRSKWTTTTPNLKPNDIVLLKDDNHPPLHWPLARVKDVHPGPDGRVRIATISTATGTYRRPITKLCMLPLSSEDSF